VPVNIQVFPFTEVSVSEVPAILKKLVSKEMTSEAIISKLYLAARPCLCDIILYDLKLAGRRKPATDLHQNVFFPRDYPLHYLQCYHFPVWSMFSWKQYGSRAAITQRGSQKACRKPFGQNFLNGIDATEMQPGCLVLFKMVAMMSNFCFLGDEFHKENLHFRGWGFGEWLNLVQGFY